MMASTDPRVAEYMAKPFARLIVRDPEGTYSARVVEFRGCYAGGDTEEEAARNLTEAMQAWIESELEEGRTIPEPALVGTYSGNTRLRLPRSLHERAAQRAELEGVSLNQLFVSAIAGYLGGADALAELRGDLVALKVDISTQVNTQVNIERADTREALPSQQLYLAAAAAKNFVAFDSISKKQLINMPLIDDED